MFSVPNTPSLRVSRYTPRFCPPFSASGRSFCPPKFDHVYHFIQILLGPISKPTFSACKKIFCPPKLTKSIIIPTASTKLKGAYWFHLARLSICGRNGVRHVSSTILIAPISYLHILSSNFRRCVACIVCFTIKKFKILANSLNL